MKTLSESFLAFFSYARLNDEHDNGKITLLRKILQTEIWVQTGKPFQIFQDYENIEWGQAWKDRITSALDTSSFLITIVTPSYLVSRSCRFEFQYFLDQEAQHKLILPILYIDSPGLKDTNDEIAIEISKRQWIDWRDLRFASLTSAKMNKKLEILAKQIRDLIKVEASAINISSKTESEFPPDSVVRVGTRDEAFQKVDPEQPKIPPSNLSRISPSEESEDEKTPLLITILLRSTDDTEHDKRRIKAVYGTLISFLGRDYFSFQVVDKDKEQLIDFPQDTTHVCPELLERLKKLLGEESWHVEEITFQ